MIKTDCCFKEDSIRKDIKKVIDALMYCETNKMKCSKCNKKKRGNCLLFVRDSTAVALQFILTSLTELEKPPENGLYL